MNGAENYSAPFFCLGSLEDCWKLAGGNAPPESRSLKIRPGDPLLGEDAQHRFRRNAMLRCELFCDCLNSSVPYDAPNLHDQEILNS
jgi:hypothetical protein